MGSVSTSFGSRSSGLSEVKQGQDVANAQSNKTIDKVDDLLFASEAKGNSTLSDAITAIKQLEAYTFSPITFSYDIPAWSETTSSTAGRFTPKSISNKK